MRKRLRRDAGEHVAREVEILFDLETGRSRAVPTIDIDAACADDA